MPNKTIEELLKKFDDQFNFLRSDLNWDTGKILEEELIPFMTASLQEVYEAGYKEGYASGYEDGEECELPHQ